MGLSKYMEEVAVQERKLLCIFGCCSVPYMPQQHEIGN